MSAQLNVLGVILLQEVGFDIVWLWPTSNVIKVVAGIFLLGVIALILRKAVGRNRKSV